MPNAAPRGAAVVGGVSDYKAYVGGRAGPADPNLPPVTIGFVNVEGTAGGAPEASVAAEAAATYINASLGGIGGHPLVVKKCVIATAADGARCGQQMRDDPAVSAVAFGTVYLGDQAFNTVLGGRKPVLVGVATGASEPTARNTFILFGDLTHVFGPWGTYARDVLHAKTAALLYTDNPVDEISAAAIRKGLQAAGVTVTAAMFDVRDYDPTTAAVAAGVTHADMTVPISEGAGCAAIARVLQELHNTRPVVATPICLSDDVLHWSGGDLPQWTYGVAQTLPSDVTAPDAAAYLDASARAGLGNADQEKVWAAVAWSLVITYARLLNGIGPNRISPDAVSAALTAFRGPVVMGAPQVDCRKYRDAPAVCNDQARFYQYQGIDRYLAVTGWLRPPG
ncbi:MAG TPA: ABC transporter substrate-binding protein [Rugosimonospora sp.]|nr:ABC transporter substrate-binding protein [Rugosimonospora sp.]